jgi:signal transduction histidine kinase
MIDEILLASRLDALAESPQFESIELLALVAEECARYAQVELEGELVTVRGDARLLRRLLRNLLENANKYGRAPIAVSLRSTDDGAQLCVSDAGPGVPAEEQERIFEPFYRRRGGAENIGAGLGLALVRQIAEKHGGKACCEALETGGTRFVIQLPQVGESPS